MHHVTQAPSFTRNPHNGDVYSAYNKPEAVIDWLAQNDIEEDFVLILDADMIMRAPFIPEDLGAKEGTAISAFYGYLKVQSPLRHHNLDGTVSACRALKPLAVQWSTTSTSGSARSPPKVAHSAVQIYGVQGVNNALALKHVPEVPPREDELAGPKGRRGDQVPPACLFIKDGVCMIS